MSSKLKVVNKLFTELESLPESSFHNYRVEFTVYTDLTLTEVIKYPKVLRHYSYNCRSKTSCTNTSSKKPFLHSSFAYKADFLFNMRETINTYSRVLRGRSTNTLSRDQKYALASILNSTGLWSGHWAR